MYDEIDYLGFPLSVSEEFQKRNTNKSISQAYGFFTRNTKFMYSEEQKFSSIFIYEAFGNPYGEKYHPEIITELTNKLHILDVKTITF